jgi:dihydrofolate reductase
MARLRVQNSLTLDGVMQAPGGPDEDRRDGFEYGGWAQPYFDPVMAEAAGESMSGGGAMLFGRRTYEQFASFWPHQPADDPFAKALNESHKYVASTTLEEPLPWANSTLLKGDVADAVAKLKEELEVDLVILGSGELIRSLMPHGLIDEYTLQIHPLVLGSGRRLFTDDGAYSALRLVKSKATTKGVLLATYEPTEAKTASDQGAARSEAVSAARG